MLTTASLMHGSTSRYAGFATFTNYGCCCNPNANHHDFIEFDPRLKRRYTTKHRIRTKTRHLRQGPFALTSSKHLSFTCAP
mmetsp:Transcript_27834/g.69939  ORF Transcript_27834/g.69939 Transcript_27834/m.69939 type:complete len:81 (+) Transcript_27834:198-440(+)